MADQATDAEAPFGPAGLFGPADLERRLRSGGVGPEDRAGIGEIKDEVLKHLDEHVAAFFEHLASFPEAQALLRRPDLMEEARRLERDHLVAMASGTYDRDYVEQRFRLGRLYNRAQLDVALFMGAFHAQMSSIGRRIMQRYAKDAVGGFARFSAFKKIAFVDLGIVVDAMMTEREGTIRRQQQAILELSTPALQVRERLLILPIIGLLDTFRAKQLTDGLLKAIRAHRAKVVVMDLTGVSTVDSKVANHLIQTVAAARLMGATVIVTGLSSDVAQSLVTLGVDLSRLNTIGDLQGGIEEAERILGPASPRIERRPAVG
ncbi:MAG: STAS domain-containing protein [Caulobacterales bacterium]|nr:STAS domain-containing protein [Caulobacterales bacterium]